MKNLKALLLALLAMPFLLALSPGEPAPSFTAKNQDGQTVRLADQKGKFVLVYFYPADETPGCTTEACSLRDRFAELKKLNTVIYGVSRQDAKSHQEFKSKHKLPFDLLVDTDGALGRAFGVGTYPGSNLSLRQSVLIGPDGHVVKTYPNVNPAEHVSEIIADVKRASAK